LLVTLSFDADKLTTTVTVGLGIALMLLSICRGPITERHGGWDRFLV